MLKIFIYFTLSIAAALHLSAQIPGIPSNIDGGDRSGNKTAPNRLNFQNREELYAKRKIVLEQILTDIKKVKDPERRAGFLSAAGKNFCADGDKPKALELFEKAVSEYYQAKAAAEKINDQKSFSLIYGGAARIFIIQDINDCDPELAYQYLLKTRPQKLSENLNALYQNPDDSILIPALRNTVGWEIVRESSLKREILKNKSDRLEEIIKSDLETFVSTRTLDSLNQLFSKNPSLATELTEKAVEKLIKVPMFDAVNKKPLFLPFPNSFQTAVSFLKAFEGDSRFNRNKIKISTDSLLKLADKIIKESIDAQWLWLFEEELKIIQRLLPDRYAQYEQMKAEKLRTPEEIEKQNLRELLKRNVAVEKLLSDAKNYSEKNQKEIYITAACRSAAEDDFKLTADILNENLADKANADKRLSIVLYSLAIEALKLQEKDYLKAEKLIGQMTDPQLRIDAQALLAQLLYYKSKTNNKEKALSLLSDAMKTLKEKADIINRYEAFSDIILGYSVVDPETAFLLFDSLLNTKVKFKDNDEKYTKYYEIRDLRRIAIYGGVANFSSRKIISNLRNSNFEKTLNIIEKKNPVEAKITHKLSLLNTEKLYDDVGLTTVERYCR